MARPKNDGLGRLGGRAKGTPNKRTQDIMQRCQDLGCDPVEILVYFATANWQALGYDTRENKITGDWYISSDQRLTAARDLMQYLYPKRKSIEVKSQDQDTTDEDVTTKVSEIKSTMKAATERRSGRDK